MIFKENLSNQILTEEISKLPPNYGVKSKKKIENVSLAQVWSESEINPSGYWISEKFDGIRGIWKGNSLFTRYGKKLQVPSWWKMHFSRIYEEEFSLDGELFLGYNQWSSIQRINFDNSLWKNVKFMIFDLIPSSRQVNELIFEERIKLLKEIISENELIKIVEYEKCHGVDDLNEKLEKITSKGGEGLILRKPKSIYNFGRSYSLLKVKKQNDLEVKFLQKSSTGISFDCLLPSGLKEKIKCGISDYNNPPLSGDILCVSHFGFTKNGTLKFPYFLRVRYDVNWN